MALPDGDPKTVRGYSAPSLIIEDEAAFVSDDTFEAILPMLAANPDGRIVLLSTPNLCFGHFHRIWFDGAGWEKYEVPSRDCPRISPRWLEERRRENPLSFEREYECRFGSAEGSLFTPAMLDRMVAADFPIFDLGI